MRRAQRPAAGFTLIELLIVVIILGVLAAIVIASFGRSQSEASNGTFVSNLRAYANSFAVYAHQKGVYPPDQLQGVHPPQMAGVILAEEWTRPTPIGGQWDWDFGQFGFTAGLSVYQPDRTPAEMADIDKLIDDGDLNTGVFRQRANGYIFVIQQSPGPRARHTLSWPPTAAAAGALPVRHPAQPPRHLRCTPSLTRHRPHR